MNSIEECYDKLTTDMLMCSTISHWTQCRSPVALNNFMRKVEIAPPEPGYTLNFNYNEEGNLHSKYLGNRYEPAIVISCDRFTIFYYLFDGTIKDCIHPFYILIYKAGCTKIKYYSTERISTNHPVVTETYTSNDDLTLHDYIEGCDNPLLPFKFVD